VPLVRGATAPLSWHRLLSRVACYGRADLVVSRVSQTVFHTLDSGRTDRWLLCFNPRIYFASITRTRRTKRTHNTASLNTTRVRCMSGTLHPRWTSWKIPKSKSMCWYSEARDRRDPTRASSIRSVTRVLTPARRVAKDNCETYARTHFPVQQTNRLARLHT
jgi:hypothetical protein